jgi:hypothetical protein
MFYQGVFWGQKCAKSSHIKTMSSWSISEFPKKKKKTPNKQEKKTLNSKP